jgi:ABC-type polysaccharide transport system permease subunit
MQSKELEMRTGRTRSLIQAVRKDWRLYVLLLPMVLWFFVTILGKAPTLISMIFMRIKKILRSGYERVLLLYRSNIYLPEEVVSM